MGGGNSQAERFTILPYFEILDNVLERRLYATFH